jgi:multidrug efflux pump subunit AcrB
VENISLSVYKRQSANVTAVANDVRDVAEELTAADNSVTVLVSQDASEIIVSSVTTVATALVLGVIISMTILFLFFGDIRASLVVGSSIPVSLLVTFITMNLMGFSLNMITMSALVLGIGMMVDNSIVVLDSCFKSVGADGDLKQAALTGTKFVIASVAGSTATTVVVFFPLALITGMSGQIFGPLGFTIIFALTASLVSALTLVPLLFLRFHPRENEHAPLAKLLKGVEAAYVELVSRLLPRRKTVMFTAVALLAFSFLIASALKVELLPAVDEGIVLMEVETRPGTKLEAVSALMSELEALVVSYPDVEDYALTVGGGGGMDLLTGAGNTASLYLYLADDRTLSTDEVISSLREAVREMPDCVVDISQSGSNQTPGSGSGVEINLKGNHLASLKEAATPIAQLMENHPDIVKVTSTAEESEPQMEIIVDPLMAAGYGLTPAQTLGNVRLALSGQEVSRLLQDDQEFEIWVEYPAEQYQSIQDISSLVILSPTGNAVPLLSVATMRFANAPESIAREDNEYIVTITGTPTAEAKFTAAAAIQELVEALELPEDVRLAESSLVERQTEEFSSLGMAIAAAVLLVFMVMAIQFESPKFSLMVMLCVPFSLVGSFSLLFLSGTSLSMASILGFLVLVGTVVNNGILFVGTVNQYRADSSREEAIRLAARTRLRPILMTTLTTALAIVPMALGIGRGTEMMQGLGVVVIGGLIASALLSLLLLPTFYLIIDGKKS